MKRKVMSIKTGDMKLDKAITEINTDVALRKDFYRNPVKVLDKLGVNTGDLSINVIDNDFIKDIATSSWSVCVSIGEVIGVSVGT
jgi:hypothetical protein